MKTSNTTTVKRGRKLKHYTTTWGDTIVGLSRRPDGRWRNLNTGQSFREPDERLAVAKFRQMAGGRDVITISATVAQVLPQLPTTEPTTIEDRTNRIGQVIRATRGLPGVATKFNPSDLAGSVVSFEAAGNVLWGWLRQQLIERPEWVAARVGIPQLAGLADMPLPRESVKLADLLAAYKEHAEVSTERKVRVEAEWNRFVKITGAVTVRDLSTEALLEYKDQTVENPAFRPETIKQYFSRITTVICFGQKRGFNAAELKACLDRCEVLAAPKSDSVTQPLPISPENFHKMLAKADKQMKAALLLSLNAALYASELLLIEWADLDLKAGTYCDKRNKTGVIRAATLWTETVEALKEIFTDSTQPIFPSRTGLNYSTSGMRDLFNQLKEAAGVSSEVKYSHLRDGAVTAGCAAGVPFHTVQLLAGHKMAGQADNYVARNPKMVAPACEAVHAHYFPAK